VVSRDELFDIVYNREGGPEDRSVDVQIGRLRRKIEIDPRRPALIKTIRGLGYLFTAEIERS
jgi:DNA-binding response OmpR family regulator